MNRQMGEEHEISISLIIPTYKREELLVNTLRCALAQNRDDYEIIVVDQTPQHETATQDFLRVNAKEIHIVKLERPSVTAARNAGLRAANGTVLVFIDDDTSFGSDFLTRHFETYGAGVGAVQGRVTEANSVEHSQPAWLNRWIRFSGGDNCPHDGMTNNLTGCNFSVSRKTVRDIGFFDERYSGVAVREETDYALRIVAGGYKIKFCAAAAVFHHRSDSGGHGEGGNILFFNKLYYFNEMLFAKKHFSSWAVGLYRIRLRLRGRRALRHLIKQAELEAGKALRGD